MTLLCLARCKWPVSSSKGYITLFACHQHQWGISPSLPTLSSATLSSANYSATAPSELRPTSRKFTAGTNHRSQARLQRSVLAISSRHATRRNPLCESLTPISPSKRRSFSTNVHRKPPQQERDEPSNRAAFKATPIIPSILAYIEKIGVGMRKKKSKYKRRSPRSGASSSATGKRRGGGGDTLDAVEEFDYFTESQQQHRRQSQDDQRDLRNNSGGSRAPRTTSKTVASDGDNAMSSESRGAYWLPPPPFASSAKDQHQHDTTETSAEADRQIIRRPVKLLGNAGSLDDDLPRDSKGLAEVAIAGRSNVGKSTLLNALLYGNTDDSLSPRKYQRGKTPDRAKLPKGVKALTSAKPGQTKELSFYQLTADVFTENDSAEKKARERAKMSLLLVDLPGYGFAFAKEERTIEWKNLMHYYLLERRSLKRILLLLDARHGFKKTDFDFLGDLQDGLMAKVDDGKKARRELPPIQIVLTKCDLVKQADLARRIVIVKKELSDFLIREPSSLPVMLVSARAGVGFNNIRKDTPLGGVLELQRELASLVPMPRAHRRTKVNAKGSREK